MRQEIFDIVVPALILTFVSIALTMYDVYRRRSKDIDRMYTMWRALSEKVVGSFSEKELLDVEGQLKAILGSIPRGKAYDDIRKRVNTSLNTCRRRRGMLPKNKKL